MSFRIEYYDENFLDAQYEIGNLHLSTWLGAQQSDIEKLRSAYSKEGFDPETKMYLLEDEKVVGFITSGISKTENGLQANMELPLLRTGFEEQADKLIEFAFDTFIKKGVKLVTTRASPSWGNTVQMAEKWGFKFKEILWRSARLDVDEFNLEAEPQQVDQMSENYHEKLVQLLKSERGMTEEESKAQILRLQEIPYRVVNWAMIVNDGEISAYDHLVQDIRIQNKARMNHIYAKDRSLRDRIMASHVYHARKRNIQYLDNFFWDASAEAYPLYENYGFEISPVSSYNLNL